MAGEIRSQWCYFLHALVAIPRASSQGLHTRKHSAAAVAEGRSEAGVGAAAAAETAGLGVALQTRGKE